MYFMTKPVFYQGKRLSPECITMMYQITIGHIMLAIAMIIMCVSLIASGFFGHMASDLYEIYSYKNSYNYEISSETKKLETNSNLYGITLISEGNLNKAFKESLIRFNIETPSISQYLGENTNTTSETPNDVSNEETVHIDEVKPLESEVVVEEEKVEVENTPPIITSSDGYVAGTTVTVTSEALDGLVANNYYGYTKEDYDYLLMTIVGEAQNCSVTEQMYVGSVVLNRYYADSWFKYGDTIKDICLAPNQYTCFKYGGAYKTPTETNKQVAAQLLKYGSILPANVIWQSLFKQGDGVYWYFEDTGTYICYNDGMPY